MVECVAFLYTVESGSNAIIRVMCALAGNLELQF